MFETLYVGQTIDTFRHHWNNWKAKDWKFQRSEPYPRTLVSAFLNPRSQWFSQCFHNIHRKERTLQIDLNVKFFCEKHLWLWRPMDLILKIVSEFYHIDNIGFIIDTFFSAYILHFMDYWNDLFFLIWVMENEFL